MDKDCRFPIDFIEFSFLVEACIPPRPIARTMFWEEVINKHYHNMTDEETRSLHQWINKNPNYQDGLKEKNELCLLFEARFNPNNQYKVYTDYNGKKEIKNCFKYENNYHLSLNKSVIESYITKVEKLNK